MPLTTISTPRGKTPGQLRALLDGVHAALVAAFSIPEGDRFQVIDEVDPAHWVTGDRAYDVLVEIKAFAGRSTDAKRALYKGIAANLAGAGFDPLRVFIIVHDLPRENWGLRGGVAGCDLDFGFKIDV